eukprot:CAMPEP_0173418702 /NCGR_PEP_ID=MMETSP1357-20121228/771_1 /TAXON_ID=77926 /ORGANISM="Hemiselmis rufescens, Strain PCC563" /LENGTH=420 /DNA_ID=CAMNT_0014381239 /DNA_START=305 /DNA_END=1567 /DNA_ORIENTATION=+
MSPFNGGTAAQSSGGGPKLHNDAAQWWGFLRDFKAHLVLEGKHLQFVLQEADLPTITPQERSMASATFTTYARTQGNKIQLTRKECDEKKFCTESREATGIEISAKLYSMAVGTIKTKITAISETHTQLTSTVQEANRAATQAPGAEDGEGGAKLRSQAAAAKAAAALVQEAPSLGVFLLEELHAYFAPRATGSQAQHIATVFTQVEKVKSAATNPDPRGSKMIAALNNLHGPLAQAGDMQGMTLETLSVILVMASTPHAHIVRGTAERLLHQEDDTSLEGLLSALNLAQSAMPKSQPTPQPPQHTQAHSMQLLEGQEVVSGKTVCSNCGAPSHGAYHTALTCRKAGGGGERAKGGRWGARGGCGGCGGRAGPSGGTPPRDPVQALAAQLDQGGGRVVVHRDGKVFDCELTELSVNDDSE